MKKKEQNPSDNKAVITPAQKAFLEKFKRRSKDGSFNFSKDIKFFDSDAAGSTEKLQQIKDAQFLKAYRIYLRTCCSKKYKNKFLDWYKSQKLPGRISEATIPQLVSRAFLGKEKNMASRNGQVMRLLRENEVMPPDVLEELQQHGGVIGYVDKFAYLISARKINAQILKREKSLPRLRWTDECKARIEELAQKGRELTITVRVINPFKKSYQVIGIEECAGLREQNIKSKGIHKIAIKASSGRVLQKSTPSMKYLAT